jgi:hypothetical protein
VGQLSELVQLSDTPGHWPIGAHAALPPTPPPPPPPPIEMQHSWVVGSQVVVPQAMGVSGMPLSPMVPPDELLEPPDEPPELPPDEPPELLLDPPPELLLDAPPSLPPLLEPEPPPDPLLLLVPPSCVPPSSPDESSLRSSSRTVRPPQPARIAIAMRVPAYLMLVPLFSSPRRIVSVSPTAASRI